MLRPRPLVRIGTVALLSNQPLGTGFLDRRGVELKASRLSNLGRLRCYQSRIGLGGRREL